jgi:uncharacterized protein YggT (Ycf19 family)
MFSRIVSWIVGILEALLAFRLLFKFLGSDPGGAFVSFIYTYSDPFVTPFRGIIRTAETQGIETITVIAMIVYALVGYGIIRLIKILEKR